MKPLVLTMQAFGSYGQKEVIDFRKTNQNLFLITGDTGAGKTTIFDAIVFALYGEISSDANKKEGTLLQSHYVGYDKEPYVELTFSEGSSDDDIYTVRRVPMHKKLLTRGVNKGTATRQINESVSLMMPDGSEYPSKEANEKLKEIVGLTKKQFMQVAMIAQGEFMKLLRAKSNDKKEIFRKLFNTELFERIVTELGNREKSEKQKLDKIKMECKLDVSRMKIPEEYEKRIELEQLGKEITELESLVHIETYMEGLKQLCGFLKEVKDAMKEEEKKAGKQSDEKKERYAKTEFLLKAFEQLRKAEQDISECEAKAEYIKEVEMLRKKLYSAYQVKREYDKYNKAEEEWNAMQKALREQADKLPELEEQLKLALEREKHSKEAFEKESEQYAQISERVENAIKTLKEISDAAEKCKKNKAVLTRAEEKEKKEKKAFEEMTLAYAKCKEELAQINDAEVLYEKWQTRYEKIKALSEEAIELDRQKAEVDKLKKQCEKAQSDYKKCDAQFLKRKEQYDASEQKFMDNQAGVLAEQLITGKPCPVCGSLEHPSPHQYDDLGDILSKEKLDSMKQECEETRKKREACSNKAHQYHERYELTDKEYHKKINNLVEKVHELIKPETHQITIDNLQDVMKSLQEDAEKQGGELGRRVDRLKQLQNELSDFEEKQQEMRESMEACQKAVKDASAGYESAKATLAGLEKTTEYASVDEADAAKNLALNKKTEKEKIYSQDKEESDGFKQEKSAVEALICRYEKELPEKEKTKKQYMTDYEAVMDKEAITEDAWKAFTDKYEEKLIEEYNQEINAYAAKKHTAEELVRQARESIGDNECPDMEIVVREKNEAEEKLERIREQCAVYKKYYEENDEVYKKLTLKQKEREEIIKNYNRINSLYQTLSGKMTGARMDVETYVQRYYLERILEAANMRFFDMSSGQFELRMYDIEKAGEGKNRGLDLMVYSNITGKERDICTLSGGESFMAALSLALGMADQIQDASSAINLDMMFIDEGFGSLDEHSRNQAVKVLKRMAEGSKLIGLISHVSELKQEIDDQLWVSRDENGSCAVWHNS